MVQRLNRIVQRANKKIMAARLFKRRFKFLLRFALAPLRRLHLKAHKSPIQNKDQIRNSIPDIGIRMLSKPFLFSVKKSGSSALPKEDPLCCQEMANLHLNLGLPQLQPIDWDAIEELRQ